MSYFADVLALSPAAFWELQEVSGTTADNAQGNAAFDGTYTSGSGSYTLGQSTTTPGVPLDVLFVPGGFVDTSGGAIAAGQTAYTILALINTTETSFSFDRTIYGEAQGSGSFRYIRMTLDASSKKLSFERNGTSGIEVVVQTSGSALNDGNDHLVAVVVNGTSVTLYVDGASVTTSGTISGTVSSSGQRPNIAALVNVFGGTGRCWSGEIGAVAVWQTNLSGTDILNLYNSATSAPCNPPVNGGGTMAPVATGTTVSGDVVSVSNGVWSGDATIVYTYQWQRDCASGFLNIPSETSSTYQLTDDDIGCDVRCVVTGTNSCAPAGTANSNSLGPVTAGPPTNLVAPVITGVPLPGHSLLVISNGTWTGLPTSYDYEWFADDGGGYVSTGNVTNTILLVDGDIGSFFKCEVTANN